MFLYVVLAAGLGGGLYGIQPFATVIPDSLFPDISLFPCCSLKHILIGS